MSESTPSTPVVVRPWLIPLLTGVIGLLLGSLITAGVLASVNATRSTAAKPVVSQAAVKAADKRYSQALFDCSVQPSDYLIVDRARGIMRITSESEDGSVPGLSNDIGTCLVNSLGASIKAIHEMVDDSGTPTKHRVQLGGVELSWASRGDGGFLAIVAPIAGT